MTSNDISSPNPIPYDHPWQTLIEFTLSSKPDQEKLVLERVGKAMQTLNWPLTHLEQLNLALAQAMRNAMERIHLVGSETWLVIRVLIPAASEATPAADQAGDEQIQRRLSERVSRQIGYSTSRGWGFFLVQKQENDLQASTGEPHQVIELFLYQESHPPFR